MRYEAWAHEEIARLEELHLLAQEEQVESRLALAEHEELVPQLQRLVRDEPFRGHANPAITAKTYARMFDEARHADAVRDARAASALGAAIEGRRVEPLVVESFRT